MVRKSVLICLSSLLTPEDGPVACQLMYWFMKSYSNHTVPPAPFGISDGVPTSNTLHPQAQAQVRLGVRPMRKTAATNSRLHVFPASIRETAALAKRATPEIPRINFLPASTFSEPPN